MFDDEDEDVTLSFDAPLGEHVLPDEVRRALVWASIQKFVVDTIHMENIDAASFSQRDRNLARSVVFHGPFEDFEKAIALAQQRQGVVLSVKHEWTEESQPVWVVCLAN